MPTEKLTRHIPLSQGQVAIVDAEDYEFLMQWNWYAAWMPSTQSYYATSYTSRCERSR